MTTRARKGLTMVMVMSSPILLLIARGFVAIYLIAFIACLLYRIWRRLPITAWTVWIVSILASEIGAQYIPDRQVAGAAAGLAIIIFGAFVPRWIWHACAGVAARE
jgi:fatty-acid desaturase